MMNDDDEELSCPPQGLLLLLCTNAALGESLTCHLWTFCVPYIYILIILECESIVVVEVVHIKSI